VPRLTIAICTYRRPVFLGELLTCLRAPTHLDHEVLVIDNDPEATAHPTFVRVTNDSALARDTSSNPWRYLVEPEPGVSSARNRAVAEATSDTLLFLDDDQLVAPGFIDALWSAWLARPNGVDGLRLDVRIRFEPDVPARARALFLDMHTHDYDPIDRALFGTGGLVASRTLLASESPTFLPQLSLLGGEDTELFIRLHRRGAIFAHLASVHVEERITRERANLGWLLRRQFRAGILDTAINDLHGLDTKQTLRSWHPLALARRFVRNPRAFIRPTTPLDARLQRLAHAAGKLYALMGGRLESRRDGPP
jgi:hypothetical protein